MSQALQVSFRQLIPSEGLVGLAAERYRRFGSSLHGPSQCWVSLEALPSDQAQTLAQVRIESGGTGWAHAEARHSDPYTALETALTSLEAQLRAPRRQRERRLPGARFTCATPLLEEKRVLAAAQRQR